MGEGVLDGNTDHMTPSPQTACSLVLKCFQYHQPLCYTFELIDTCWAILTNFTITYMTGTDGTNGEQRCSCYFWGCVQKVKKYCRQSRLASQVGRRRGPNRTGTRGNHGQHRSSEDKTGIQGGVEKWRGWLSCLPVNASAFHFPLFDYQLELEWRVAGSAVSFLIIKPLASANLTASDTTVYPASLIWINAG